MGICKAALDACVKYAAFDLGPQGVRVNAISAGPLRTLGGAGRGRRRHGRTVSRKWRRLAATSRTKKSAAAAAFLLSPHVRRHHRRNSARRCRLQHHGLAGPAAGQAQTGAHEANLPSRLPSCSTQGRFLVGTRPAGVPLAGTGRISRRQSACWRNAGGCGRPRMFGRKRAWRSRSAKNILSTLQQYDHGLLEVHFFRCRPIDAAESRRVHPFAGSMRRSWLACNFPRLTAR